jgi:uncharacterized membrane protein YfcA
LISTTRIKGKSSKIKPEMNEILTSGLLLVLTPMVFVVAGAYASVGLGGGTGYLAVMALVGMSTAAMTPIALFLNLVVTGTALLSFGMAGRLKWRLFLPFLLPAMPAAFLGGIVTADRRIFLALLAITLAAAAVTMFRYAPNALEHGQEPGRRRLLMVALPAGLAIGFLSGFLGIGGGVFLGPLILFLGWANPKEIAAMNSALILVLSTIALTAHGVRGNIELLVIVPLAIAALIGGFVGATFAEKRLSPRFMQIVFAVIVLIAAIRAAHDVIPK